MRFNRLTLWSLVAALPIGWAAGPAFAANITSDLEGYWTFDTDFADSSANGNDGNGVGDATITGSEVRVGSGSLALDGSGHVSVPDSTSLNITGDLTVAGFMRLDSDGASSDTSDSPHLVNKGGNSGWRLRAKNQSFLNFIIDDPNGGLPQINGGSISADDQWHHVASTIDFSGGGPGTVRLYIDGVDVGGGTIGTSLVDTSGANLNLGIGSGDNDLVGNLDDVRVYSRALTADDINALATIPEPAAIGLVAIGGVIMLSRRRRVA